MGPLARRGGPRMSRQQRRQFERQLRKLIKTKGDNCSLCGADFQHNCRTFGGLDQDGNIALVGECCVERLHTVYTAGLFSHRRYDFLPLAKTYMDAASAQKRLRTLSTPVSAPLPSPIRRCRTTCGNAPAWSSRRSPPSMSSTARGSRTTAIGLSSTPSAPTARASHTLERTSSNDLASLLQGISSFCCSAKSSRANASKPGFSSPKSCCRCPTSRPSRTRCSTSRPSASRCRGMARHCAHWSKNTRRGRRRHDPTGKGRPARGGLLRRANRCADLGGGRGDRHRHERGRDQPADGARVR